MLVAFLLVSSLVFGSCFGKPVEACSGKTLRHPTSYTPPFYTGPLYFTPMKGGRERVVIQNGKSEDPRFSLSDNSIVIRDLTEEDNGYFSIMLNGIKKTKLFELKISSCAETIKRNYGTEYRCFSFERFDVLEFTPANGLKVPMILWRRTGTDFEEDRRILVQSHYVTFIYLTQEFNGLYNFRDDKNVIVKSVQLTVKEITKTKRTKEGQKLVLDHTQTIRPWVVTFTPETRGHSVTRVSDGVVVRDNWFNGRIQVVGEAIEISPVEGKDSGNFSYQDEKGNTAMVVEVEVEKSETNSNVIYWAIGGVLGSLAFICCCRCCCCGKSSEDKTVEETAESPDVYYHGENEPAGPGLSTPPGLSAPPSSTFSYQPVVSYVPEGSTATALDPPPYHSLNFHTDPGQPQVVPPEGWGSAPDPAPPFNPNVPSSENEPTFELKGVTFPSAPPLSSLSPSSDAYTSEKLNFL